MIEHLKKSWVTLVTGLIFGIFLQALTGIPWSFIPSLLMFIVTLDIIVGEINKNQGAKTAIKNLTYFFAGLIAFIGMRAVFGYLIDMPASWSYAQLEKSGGLMGIAWSGITAPAIIVDILFILPGAGFSYLLVNGGKFWKGTMALTCIILMVGVIWGIKQPAHSQAAKRQVQAKISLDANHRNNNALVKESAAASSYGIAKTLVTRFYGLDIKTNEIVKNIVGFELPQGSVVLQTKPGEKAHMAHGQAFTSVILPDKNGSFIGGEWVWVESTQFDWVDGGNILQGKKFVVGSEKTTKIVFDTDDKVVILENWQAGQKIKISGYGDNTVYFRDGSRLAKVPASGVITSDVNQPLEIKYRKGEILYINM